MLENDARLKYQFPASNRLHVPAEFSAVMATRSRFVDGCFELRFQQRPFSLNGPFIGEPGVALQPRLGLIVPKRYAKQAVLRNLLKRLSREAFRNAKNELPAIDIVVRLTKRPMDNEMKAVGAAEQRRIWRSSIDRLLSRLPRASKAPGDS